ncbi:MAG TPA: pantoate--beta-alanine ligase [Acetobacteraceae bacterium]|nr:pantoate--beta-alanine ligase [Acetobacteraceae bacterium]
MASARFRAVRIARELPALRDGVAEMRAAGRSVALVPTMGALHAGHLALVAAAREVAQATVASIFVNPLQFGTNEDLDRYPRDEAGDLAALREAGCDLAWLPTREVMYPPGEATTVEVRGPAEGWEGAVRPGHFRGVATVCTKLFCQVGAEIAVFGEKDWQQLQVVRRVVRDLALPVRIAGVPTVREPDGLAMSSRNRFLAPVERALAPRLFAELRRAAEAIGAGAPVAESLAAGSGALQEAGFGVDYFALVEGDTMRPLPALGRSGAARMVAAARLGTVRLLDNLPVPFGA